MQFLFLSQNKEGVVMLAMVQGTFQCWDILIIWIIVGQGFTVLVVGAERSCLNIFSLAYHIPCFLPLSGK